MSDETRIPDYSHRTVIVGRTGTGKSQGGIHLLSLMDWEDMPWVIIDYKGEDLVQDILARSGWKSKVDRYGRRILSPTIHATVRPISFDDKLPRKPGLYYLRATAQEDDKAMEEWLRKVHARGSIGLFIDEGYAMPGLGDSPAFTAILTQGRTLHIPVIVLYQRPVWMSRFAVAQADFIRVFKQGDIRDKKTVKNYCAPATLSDGRKIGPEELDTLPDYYSIWHDVGRGKSVILKPAPDRNSIMRTFRERLTPHRRGVLV